MFAVMVVEDDPVTRRLTCQVLRRGGYDPIPASDGVEALSLMDRYHVDLFILDIMMPKMDGFEFIRTVRGSRFETPILMTTAKGSLSDKRQAFSAGADDYMVKPIDEEELLLRVSALLRRAKIATERRLTVGRYTLSYDALSVKDVDGGEQILPQKEFLLLFKLLSYPGRIFTRRQLMDEIWGMESDTDERTVDVHIKRLRDRFPDARDFEIVTIRGLGYRANVTGEEKR
ncbi:MAG: response regulator transcription factor [Clostridia bacterium]|nr:response regulator transcription factor [Clostridia bacterium]